MKALLVTSPHLDHSLYLAEGTRQFTQQQRHYAQTFVPMGLLSLAGAAKLSADIKIADINKALNARIVRPEQSFYDEAASWLLSSRPDVVGFMSEADSYHHLIQICRRIKKQRPEVETVLGGVCASENHCETLRRFPEVDYVIRNEGEVAFPEFLDALAGKRPLEQVGNLTFRAGSDIHVNDERPLIPDLDTLPFPDLSAIDVSPDDAIWVEIGRGCPFKCNFCVTAQYWKRRHRIKSPARIIAELDYFRAVYGRSDFNFTHDLFTTDRRWVIRFCQALDKANLGVTWTCSSRTDTIDDEQIHWMKQAGCRDIYFGVESGTVAMQENIEKNLDLNEADRVIRRVLSEGIGATVGFIVGLPGESESNLRGTLTRAHDYLALGRTTVHLFGFCPYRGSPHFEKIRPQLVFDRYFVDFPVPSQAHDENCALMAEHFDVFSRYSRMQSYGDVDVSVIRTAEEYFPIINTLRDLVDVVVNRGLDPLELLVAWSRWVVHKNDEVLNCESRRFYGTISQYLCFLRELCGTKGILDDGLDEALRWEELKDSLRLLQASRFRPPVPSRMEPSRYFTNCTVKIETFAHLHTVRPSQPFGGIGEFAFFVTRAGVPQIVQLNPLATVVLEAAHKGTTVETFANQIGRAAELEDGIPYENLVVLFDQLESLDLLVRPRPSQLN